MQRLALSLSSVWLIGGAAITAGAAPAEQPLRVEVVASGLEIPWALGFAPDGRLFVTERPGRIRVIDEGGLREEPWATLPVANWGAAGLSGLAIDPAFSVNGHIYVVGTFRLPDDRFENRIYRFTDSNGSGVEQTLLVGNLPSVDTHAGGAFAFGPDGKLYLAVGDGERIEEVQDPGTTTGKVLRYDADGSIPADNPTPGSPVYALGVRNPQGFAWHPETSVLFATEHGPSGFATEGGREDEDELNVIQPGGNYGWPVVSGMHDDPRYLRPLVEWTPAIAPSGLAIVTNRDSRWYGQLFVGALRGQHLRRVAVTASTASDTGWRVTDEEVIFDHDYGRIRAVAFGPDGFLYFTSSNRDTPGEPVRNLARPGDDRIYRLSVR